MLWISAFMHSTALLCSSCKNIISNMRKCAQIVPHGNELIQTRFQAVSVVVMQIVVKMKWYNRMYAWKKNTLFYTTISLASTVYESLFVYVISVQKWIWYEKLSFTVWNVVHAATTTHGACLPTTTFTNASQNNIEFFGALPTTLRKL